MPHESGKKVGILKLEGLEPIALYLDISNGWFHVDLFGERIGGEKLEVIKKTLAERVEKTKSVEVRPSIAITRKFGHHDWFDIEACMVEIIKDKDGKITRYQSKAILPEGFEENEILYGVRSNFSKMFYDSSQWKLGHRGKEIKPEYKTNYIDFTKDRWDALNKINDRLMEIEGALETAIFDKKGTAEKFIDSIQKVGPLRLEAAVEKSKEEPKSEG